MTSDLGFISVNGTYELYLCRLFMTLCMQASVTTKISTGNEWVPPS